MDIASWFGMLWCNDAFLKVWAAETVSFIGSQVTTIALPLTAVLALHASVFEMGLLNAVDAPTLVLGLFIGVWVDRHRRKPLMVGSSLGRMLILASIPVAALFKVLTIWQVYLVSMLHGVLSNLFGTAYRPFLSTLLPTEDLVEANSKIEVSASTAHVIGPGLGGVLVQKVSAPFAIALDALSFLIAVLLLQSVHVHEQIPPASDAAPSVRREMWESVRLIYDSAVLRAMVAIYGLLVLFEGVFLATYILYVTREVGLSSVVLGGLYGMGGIGSLVGALVNQRLTRRLGIGPTIATTVLIAAVANLLVPLAGVGGLRGTLAQILLLGAAQFVQGTVLTVFYVDWYSLFPALVPNAMQGRFTATSGVLIFSTQPVGSFLAGTVATFIGVQQTLLMAVVAWNLVSLSFLLSPLAQMRRLPPPTRDGRRDMDSIEQ